MLKVKTLKKRSDFLSIAARGDKYVTPAFVLQKAAGFSADEDLVHVGYTASKRVGNAVARNRAKRRLRELTRQVFPTHAKPGVGYVLIARGYALNRGFEKMHAELNKALVKLND